MRQVAHTLDGSGLMKARGHTRREFEQQLRSLLQDNGLRRGTVAVAYVGSQVWAIRLKTCMHALLWHAICGRPDVGSRPLQFR